MYLEVKDLVKYYNEDSPIIKKLNFSVKKGEIISFIGESGSGKTTFLKCISGLEKINSGMISLNDKILNNGSIFVKPQDRKIGFVFQDYPLFPHLNLKENVTFNLKNKYFKKFDYMIALTGLQDLLYRYPHELSGGEQQRACIARALNIKLSIRDEIYKIIKETKTTTVLVTHDINDSLNIADRILIFKAGVLQQYDDPINMYCEPANCYCAKILGDLNQIEINNKTYYLRPENIKIVKKSINKILVEKCFFQGKEYKIKGKLNNNNWYFFSKKPIKKMEYIYIDYSSEDLIFFDSLCSNFFK